MADSRLGQLLERNETASKSWQPMPTIEDLHSMNLGKATVIVTCADSRNDVATYLSLKPGEIPIMRNAGGRVTDDMLTSLELLSTVIEIGNLIVIHHTDCGGLYMSDDAVRSTLSERFPEHATGITHKSWLCYRDIGMDQSIRDDIAALKKWKFLPKGCSLNGFVFDIRTGMLKEVS